MLGPRALSIALAAAFVLANPGAGESVVTVVFVGADGTREATATERIGARQRRARLLTDLFPVLSGQDRRSGYLRVTASMPVAAFAFVAAHDLSILSAVPLP